MRNTISWIIIFDIVITGIELFNLLRGNDPYDQYQERSDKVMNGIIDKTHGNMKILIMISFILTSFLVYSCYCWFKILAVTTHNLMIPAIYICCDMIGSMFKSTAKFADTCKLALAVTILKII